MIWILGPPRLHYQTMIINSNGGWITIQTRFMVDKQVKILVSQKKQIKVTVRR